MRLIKDASQLRSDTDKKQALALMNRLRAGDRVFGEPAQGLKITLAKLEKELASATAAQGKLDWSDGLGEVRDQIKLTKAGITGEERLAEWLERVVKYDPDLEDIVFFASLSDPEQDSGGGEWISDSDFLAVYGKSILILDAKNLRTSPELPVYLEGNTLLAVGGAPLIELHPSVYIWQRVFDRAGISVDSVHGCVVVVNDSGMLVWKNKAWYESECKPLHISDLVKFLHDWVERCDGESGAHGLQYLPLLVEIARMQVRKEASTLPLDAIRAKFHI